MAEQSVLYPLARQAIEHPLPEGDGRVTLLDDQAQEPYYDLMELWERTGIDALSLRNEVVFGELRGKAVSAFFGDNGPFLVAKEQDVREVFRQLLEAPTD